VIDDVGQYCREIEAHLTRVNGGHLVRIVGPGFALVRGWYDDGIPLSVVLRGVEAKAARHESGASRRPLRIEFCEADVRHVFNGWRRAVGIAAPPQLGAEAGPEPADSPDERRRPSLPKHLDRAIDRLSRGAGRLDWPESLRDAAARLLGELTTLKAESGHTRGAAREAVLARLTALDADLLGAVRAAATPEAQRQATAEAEQELEAFRARLPAGQWERSIGASVDRLLRDQFGLPTLEL
jgi:hypothetical protein